VQDHTYRKPKPKTSLKLIKTKPDLRLGGDLPSEEMWPGKYLVICEGAWIQERGQRHNAVFQFSVVDGKFGGTALRHWITAADEGGFISPVGRYAHYCALALGRPLDETDPIDDPGEIFVGRHFLVFVGYRKSERAGGGGQVSEERALVRKDARDYLRVHQILSKEDLR